jgi:CubicO group peptidase (beta-lactamase class C family)
MMKAASIDAPEVATRVSAILNRRPTPGLAVAVVKSGAPERFFVHGLAHIATTTAVTEDTVFRIASISKTFTAIAVKQLWERGSWISTRPPTLPPRLPDRPGRTRPTGRPRSGIC